MLMLHLCRRSVFMKPSVSNMEVSSAVCAYVRPLSSASSSIVKPRFCLIVRSSCDISRILSSDIRLLYVVDSKSLSQACPDVAGDMFKLSRKSSMEVRGSAILLLISKLHPCDLMSSTLPGRANTSREYENARRAVIMPPPFNLDSINTVASLSPAMIRFLLRK